MISRARFLVSIWASGALRVRRSLLTGAPVGAALMLACGRDGERPSPSLDVDRRMVPARTVTLRDDRDVPLEFLFLSMSDDSTLVVVERRTQDLWRIPIREPAAATRVGLAAARGRERITGLAAFVGGVSLIDLRGGISEGAATEADPQLVARRRVEGPRTLLGFVRLTDGTFVLLEARTQVVAGRWQPADTVTLLRIVRPDSQAVLAKWARSDYTRPLGIASDFLSLRARNDTLFVAGNSPARVMPVVAAAPMLTTPVLLRGLSAAPMAHRDAERVTSDLVGRGIPAAEVAKVSLVYPPVVSALPAGAGWFVVTSMATDRFALIHICPGMTVMDLVRGSDIVGIHLLDRHVVIVREALANGRVLVEVSRNTDFNVACNP
ncbi:MAG: hypothetical protein P3A28_01855 [Gemmatimonadota bacterium]|nr:hypothetical protein [Gemmatimonadota bacterium]